MARAHGALGSTDRIALPSGAILKDATRFSIICMFLAQDNSGGATDERIYSEHEAFNDLNQLAINQTSNDLRWFYRSSGGLFTMDSTNTFGDANWHWLLAVKRAANDFQMYVDGASEGTDTTTISPSSSSNERNIGNRADGTYDSGGVTIARFMTYREAIEVDEAKAIIFSGHSRLPPLVHLEMLGNSLRDLSGNGNHGTPTNTTVSDHAPIGMPQGWWAGTDTPAAVAAAPALGSLALIGVGR